MQVHGFAIFPVFLKFYHRFINSKGVCLADFIRLCYYQIQMYYVYDSLASKIEDKTYPLLEEAFYYTPGYEKNT